MMGLFYGLKQPKFWIKKNLRLWGKSEIEMENTYYSERSLLISLIISIGKSHSRIMWFIVVECSVLYTNVFSNYIIFSVIVFKLLSLKSVIHLCIDVAS